MFPELTDERWRRLEELFAAALEVPPDIRQTFVETATSGDLDLKNQLLGMLRHADGAPERIADAIGNVARSVAPAGGWIGRHFGPYRILREIGRGGMGLVFEAVRDDEEYHKTIALKVAPSWCDVDLLRDRFRHERQILAELEHPNIARFLDGGTEHGVPYFAMEYVDGCPITEHSRNLALRDKIRLFQQVCAAVYYAHESLVVHRDLKPANILVGRDGVPKLLDFGIAKLLDPVRGGATTAAAATLWTPDYTSPEQLRGRPVTTRTDIYSLGLILYEMLTDARAQLADTSSPVALDSSICETEPPLASVRAGDRRLAGDLDDIVAKAIRKDPEGRYRSVSDLSQDLDRYLEERPVLAGSGTFAYRVRKCIRRHRMAVGAGVLLLASLSAGMISTLYQARRAERRFAQVRKLANAFVFDVHDRVQDLPGSTEARKAIVQTALTYLESLREESTGDNSLARELAGAYLRIGDVQGRPGTSNLNDTAGALASYRHAEWLLAPLARRGDRAAQRQLSSVYAALGMATQAQGDAKVALDYYSRALEISQKTLAASPNDPEALDRTGEVHGELTRLFFALHDAAGAARSAQAAMEIGRRIAALDPANRTSRSNLASAYSSLATSRLLLGELEQAAAEYRTAIEIREQLVREEPDSVVFRRNLMVGYGGLGDVLGYRSNENLGDVPGAEAAFQKAAAIADWLVRRDPADRKAQFDMFSASLRLGSLLVDDPQQAGAALRHLNESQSLIRRLTAEDPKNYRYRYNAMFVDRKIGEALETLGQDREAALHLEEARSAGKDLLQGPEGAAVNRTLLYVDLRLAKVRARAKDPRALVLADSVAGRITAAPKLLLTGWDQAVAYGQLGQVYRQLLRLADAASWLEKSRQSWREARLPKTLEPRRERELARMETDIAALQPIAGRQ